jgi:hypothetical protein
MSDFHRKSEFETIVNAVYECFILFNLMYLQYTGVAKNLNCEFIFKLF